MTNYNKISKKHDRETREILEKIDEIIPQPEPEVEVAPELEPEPVVAEPEPMPIDGVVDGCDQLYVRAEASADSEPLGIIKRDTNVRIYESESTEDFYSVCTESGLEGFCMKKFISII